VVVSARWRVVRSPMGLDPKLPLAVADRFGERWRERGMDARFDALHCNAMRSEV
jgi:hypothetical protein